MERERKNNCVELIGEIVREAAYSHSYGGEDYFIFPFRVLRLSGAEDVLNLVMSRNNMDLFDAKPGKRVGITGEIRSYNNRSGEGSRLVITVRVRAVFSAEEKEDFNRVALVGNLCRKPLCRRTPLGREIADVLLAVNRSGGRADYLPCILWGGQARRASQWAAGDRVCIRGRLQSRVYYKVLGEQRLEKRAYEVSGMEAQRIFCGKKHGNR